METKTSKTTWIKNCFMWESRDNPVFASALSWAKKLSSEADKKSHQDVRSEVTQLNQTSNRMKFESILYSLASLVVVS